MPRPAPLPAVKQTPGCAARFCGNRPVYRCADLHAKVLLPGDKFYSFRGDWKWISLVRQGAFAARAWLRKSEIIDIEIPGGSLFKGLHAVNPDLGAYPFALGSLKLPGNLDHRPVTDEGERA
jgi:hypothetical protein